ncbi:hypothetical protein CANCADRAFT_3549 [Tortispora caseinolytica NRRL Y-17796]|uniref:Ribonuclease H2 subunit B n=1 Tax=Tortispora caseinolytica NRRL Y-17796 TaxID=767744 RepID=A0A1E4TAW8_9ASCO|nr:hypothetical protein CANCADRAFT_3549 [Tortispora caseinolytica NRRL Y-17796]
MNNPRIAILPKEALGEGEIIELPNPKTKHLCKYLICNDKVFEILRFDNTGQTDLDILQSVVVTGTKDYIISQPKKYAFTPIQSFYLILNELLENSSKMFNIELILENVSAKYNNSDFLKLPVSALKSELSSVCETQIIEDQNDPYFRISEQQLIDYLIKKINQTSLSLPEQMYKKFSKKILVLDAIDETVISQCKQRISFDFLSSYLPASIEQKVLAALELDALAAHVQQAHAQLQQQSMVQQQLRNPTRAQ